MNLLAFCFTKLVLWMLPRLYTSEVCYLRNQAQNELWKRIGNSVLKAAPDSPHVREAKEAIEFERWMEKEFQKGGN